jgi:hypothetical protein
VEKHETRLPGCELSCVCNRVAQEVSHMPSLSILERFAVYIREQEYIVKSMASMNCHEDHGNDMVDLEDYLDYQRNIK